jgi:LPXTG-site transpeptidase (sortase) family protein
MSRRISVVRRCLRALSTACFIAGAAVLAWPVVLTTFTNYTTGRVQAEALAAWDHEVPPQAAAVDDRMVLEIPSLNLRRVVPEGATVDHLKRYGVGHISWTALPPAEDGASSRGPAPVPLTLTLNGLVSTPDHTRIVGIAGHRTTYGAPFFRIGELAAGDPIVLLYSGRRFVYRVERRLTTRPADSDVLDGDADEVALVTCTPPLSAAFRLIVFGRLESVAAAAKQ